MRQPSFVDAANPDVDDLDLADLGPARPDRPVAYCLHHRVATLLTAWHWLLALPQPDPDRKGFAHWVLVTATLGVLRRSMAPGSRPQSGLRQPMLRAPFSRLCTLK